MAKPDLDAVITELVELHRFFVEWFNGTCDNSDTYFEQQLLARFAPTFQIVPPEGKLYTGSDFLPNLRAVHGGSADFNIEIRNVKTRAPSADTTIATYEEWQKGAKNSALSNNGRLSCAVFMHDPDRPNGLRWLHVHETWLPDDVIAADPFNF